MEIINNILNTINDILYTYLLIALLIGAGLYFTIKSKFVQIKLLPDAMRCLANKGEKGKVNSFQALMISTASRVGSGNIAGVAAAIAIGGYGAVFWMWVMAIIGSASTFIESTLAQIYKEKNEDGISFVGGPAYYIQKALKMRWLGILFAVLLILCFAYGFNGLQSYTMSSALSYYFGPDYAQSMVPVILGLVLAVATGFVIFGGVHRIGFITSYIVPVMALIYLAMGIVITVLNVQEIPKMFSMIFESAFDFQSILGGFAGSCLVIGVKRGLFSNEAGMGSAPNAAAAAYVSHPVKQGMVQVLSVFLDTLVICTTTAFIVILSGATATTDLTGVPLVQSAVESQFGTIGIYLLTFSIFAFAFSSVIGNYYYAESNLLFIKNDKKLLTLFRCSVMLMVALGTLADFALIWNIADILMGLMALVNIFVILLLGKIAIACLNDYIEQKKQGKDPVFVAKNIGLEDVEEWK